MNLFGIVNEIRTKLENLEVDEETGEVLNFAEIEELEAERDTKVENILCYCLDLQAEEDAIKNKAKELTKRARTVANKRERLKQYVASVLNGEKFKTDRVTASWRKSETTDVEEGKESDLVAWLMENHPDWLKCEEPKPIKDSLTKAIKGGEEIPYVTINAHNNMSYK